MSSYTCPTCDIPQGANYGMNLPPRRVTVTVGDERLSVDLCSRCFDKLETMTPTARLKRIGVIHRRVKRKPEEYRTDQAGAAE